MLIALPLKKLARKLTPLTFEKVIIEIIEPHIWINASEYRAFYEFELRLQNCEFYPLRFFALHAVMEWDGLALLQVDQPLVDVLKIGQHGRYKIKVSLNEWQAKRLIEKATGTAVMQLELPCESAYGLERLKRTIKVHFQIHSQ